MTDNVTIDGAFLGGVAASIDTAALGVPLRPTAVVGNCGSAQAHAAMNGFNMWAAVATMNVQHALQDSAGDLRGVAIAFGDWDARVADSAPHGAV